MPASIDPDIRRRRAVVTAWLSHRIRVEDAKQKGMVALSNRTYLHRWEQRFAIFEFAMQASQAQPVLVDLGKGRVALYHVRPKRAKC